MIGFWKILSRAASNGGGSLDRKVFSAVILMLCVSTCGCKRNKIVTPTPMSPDEIIGEAPAKNTQTRLTPIGLLRQDSITVNGNTYGVFIALNLAEVIEGFRNTQLSELSTSQQENVGMLMQVELGNVPALESTNFDMDVAYLAMGQGQAGHAPLKVTSIEHLAANSPKPLPARSKVFFVLELAKGEVDKLGLKVGSLVRIPDDLSANIKVSTDSSSLSAPQESSNIDPGKAASTKPGSSKTNDPGLPQLPLSGTH
jgi:uncharacterized membrane protein (UPF0127 family)